MKETELNNFIMNFYKLYVKFHKMVNTWNYYEKMYKNRYIIYFTQFKYL